MNRREFLKTGTLLGGGLLARRLVYAYAQSPPLKKFVQALPGLGPSGIPVASPNTTKYPGYDYYQIGMGEYTAQLHPDLPKATRLWGYADATNPSIAPVFRPLGPVIVAGSTLTGGRPIRVTYTNNLPPVHPLPVDVTLTGAGAAQNRAVVHLHGGHVPWTSDGGPYAWFTPANGPVGPDWVAGDSIYPNDQRATLLWYHDHAEGTTRLNAYAGLASAVILRDAFEMALIGSGAIPSREIPLIIQDKTFKSTPDQWGLPGDLWYPSVYEPDRWELESEGLPPPVPSAVPEFFGDTILVNGVVYPFLDVEPRRYRLRVLNGSNARFYTLKLVYAKSSVFPGSTEPEVTKLGPAFLQIGTEGGFLPSPVLLNYLPNAPTLLLAPAERADLIVDFSQVPPGSRLILYNDAPAPFPSPDNQDDYYPGNPRNPTPSAPGYGPNTRTLMQFRVGSLIGPPDAPSPRLTLPAIVPLLESSAAMTRNLTLNEDFDRHGRLVQRLGVDQRLHAGTFARDLTDPATETPRAGSTEVWRIFNLTGDTHPIHFHLVNVQVLERQPFDAKHYEGTPRFHGPASPPDSNEMGWKETVRMNPGEMTKVIMKFEVPAGAPVSARTGGYNYVWHCHILEHEEHDMMRPLIVMP
jgi:spore coat protein A